MLSVIINHYRTPELLKLCIESLERTLASMEYEIIVRDGESMDDTADMMRESFPRVSYLPERENVGFAQLVNVGIERSRGEYLLIINADIIVGEMQSLNTLIEYLKTHERCGLVGPRLLNMNGSLQPSCFRFYSPLTLVYRRTFLGKTPWGKYDIKRFMYGDLNLKPETSNLKPFPVDWLMGSALLARRSAVQDIGLFDERFFMYFEDVDWCRRFWEKGWQVVWNPGSTLYHYHMKASHGKRGPLDVFFNPYTRIHIASAIMYFKKYGLAVPRYGV